MVLTNGHKSTSQTPKIQLTDEQILIHDLKIVGKDAVEYLKKIPESEYERACLRAFEVGLFCLERTQTNQDTEFVKRQIQSLLTEVEKAVGNVPQTVQQELIKKLGTGDGQLLAPINQQINQVSAVTKSRLTEIKTLLTQDIDPL